MRMRFCMLSMLAMVKIEPPCDLLDWESKTGTLGRVGAYGEAAERGSDQPAGSRVITWLRRQFPTGRRADSHLHLSSNAFVIAALRIYMTERRRTDRKSTHLNSSH